MSDLVSEWKEVFDEWRKVSKKLYECVDVFGEPFSGNECYRRLITKYKVLFTRLVLLERKLREEGVGVEDLLE